MAKDPAFLWYPSDWIGGTMGMTFEEKGAYIELLMMQFNRGHMTSHMIGQVVGQLWDKIKHKFTQDEHGLWYNARLDLEKERRKKYTKSRRNNLKGKNQYTKKEEKEGGHMTSHMENVNINKDINTKEGKRGLRGKKETNPKIPSLDEFLAYAREKLEDYQLIEKNLILKYHSWIENGWMTLKGAQIINWKSTLLNTAPHIVREINYPKNGTKNRNRQTDYRTAEHTSTGFGKL